MDWIYLIAYPLIILTLIRVILAYFRVENADAAKILKIHNTDIKLMVVFLVSFVIGVGLIVSLHSSSFSLPPPANHPTRQT